MRAKKGGEVGKNGEGYRGGQFLPNSNLPKRGVGDASRHGTGRQLVGPGVFDSAPDGYMSLFARLRGVYADVDCDGALVGRRNLEVTARYHGIEPERIHRWIRAYNAGGRWVEASGGRILTIDGLELSI